jgi:hypothetical protein
MQTVKDQITFQRYIELWYCFLDFYFIYSEHMCIEFLDYSLPFSIWFSQAAQLLWSQGKHDDAKKLLKIATDQFPQESQGISTPVKRCC